MTAAAEYLEEQKLAFDYVKHLTTLTTGTVVVLATFLKDVFHAPQWHALIPLTFVSLVVATLALSVSGFGLLWSVRHRGGAVPDSVRSLTGVSTAVGMMGFGLGMILLAAFSIKNWT